MQEVWKQRLKPWLTAVKIAVTAGLLALLLSRIDPVRTLELWGNIDLGWALPAIALIIPNMYFQYRRWHVGLRRVYPEIFASDATLSLLLGQAMGAITPGRLGELGQVVVLPPGGRRRAVGVMGVMRIATFFSTMSLGLAMWAWNPGLVHMERGSGRAIALLLLGATFAMAIVAERVLRTSDHPMLQRWIDRIPVFPPVFLGVQALRPVDRAKFVLWSLGMSAIYLSQLVYLMRAFGADVTWASGVAAGAITIAIVALLPVTFGSVGIRESAAVIVWHQLGVAAPVAFNAAFALFLVNVVSPGIVGVVWNMIRQHRVKTEQTP
jgi:glycosyltransferase 2 family protein